MLPNPAAWCFRLAGRHEASEAVKGGEVLVAHPGAGAGRTVGLDEVQGPGVAVVLEIEQDAGHVGSIGG